jgi:hypothetical protein
VNRSLFESPAREALAALGEEWDALGTITYHAHGTDVLMYGDQGWFADIKKTDVERLRSLILNTASALAKAVGALERIAEHPIVSESEIAADLCDWHCSVTMAAEAKDGLGIESPDD